MSLSRDEFEQFKERHSKELANIEQFLEKPMSDNPTTTKSQAKWAVGYLGRLSSIKPWAVSFFKAARRRALKPKEKGQTDLDREVNLDADVVDERRYREYISGLLDTASVYISLAQTTIKSDSEEARRQGMAT